MINRINKQNIIEQIIKAGYRPGISVTYMQLQELCRKYGNGLDEKEFARRILGVSEGNYNNCKNNKNKVRILKAEKVKLTETEKNEIKEQIKEVGYKPWQLINYEELQKLCRIYGNGLNEKDFARDILGVLESNYNACKYRGKNIRIFKVNKRMKLTEEEKEKIKEQIKKAGYEIGQSIDYEELQKLCRIYGNGLDEEEFARDILGVLENNYSSCKYRGTNIRIFKVNKRMKLTEEEKNEIKKKIKEAGYETGQLIDYEELHKLCRIYGNGLDEKEFARKILGVSEVNYNNCKYNKNKVRILKAEKVKLTEEEKEEIKEQIKKTGYETGQSIDYEELHKLYIEYGRELNEIDFAMNILGVSQNMYYRCKNKGTKVKILKEEEVKLTETEKEKIKEQIKEAGYKPGQLINYEELHKLCIEYGRGLNEKDFARDILGVLESNYSACKYRGTNIRIFKVNRRMKLSEEEMNEIINHIKEAGYKLGQLINYEELHKLCIEYGRGLNEKDFAMNILRVSQNTYYRCKNKGTKVKILKEEVVKLTDEEKDEIKEQIKEAGYKSRQLINYEELHKLCIEYGRGLNEKDFARDILGVLERNYNACKYRGKNIRIFKVNRRMKLTEAEKDEIKEQIKEAGYKPGQLINYEELHKLCIEYGRGLNEKDFARDILGVLESNYSACKYRGTNIRIFKVSRRMKLTEEEMNEIINHIKEAGYKPGQLINYEELHKLCIEYGRGLNEIEFSREIFGVSEGNYKSCKNKGHNVRIRNGIIVSKSKEICSVYLKKPRFYSMEEIEEICKEYKINIDDFITYIYLKNFYDLSVFKNSLNRNSHLWIGKVRMSETFVNSHITIIQTIATTISRSLCSKYRKKSKIEDYTHDLILYMIENMGDLEKNLGDTDDWIEIARKKVYIYLNYKIIQELNLDIRTYRFEKRGHNVIYEVEPEDTNLDVEGDAIATTIKNEISWDEVCKCIGLIKKYVEEGEDKLVALKKVQKDMNINAETLLNYMNLYGIRQGENAEVKTQNKAEKRNLHEYH